MNEDYGRETIVLVEIDQPLCSRAYGVAPCVAALSADTPRKCFNSRATCQDPANYSAGILTLRFARPQLDLQRYYGYVIPSLQSVRTTAGGVNLGGMDQSVAALGRREVVGMKFEDHQHSDFLVDKYRLERVSGAASFGGADAYDPSQRGTFWGKWLARNPYFQGYALRVYEGFVGQALADMRVRHYIIDSIDGPNGGEVSITAKDRFSQVEAKKSVAPVASRGELLANISAAATSATLAPAGIGNAEYPASGYVCMKDEVCGFTRAGDVLTLTRGQLNTVADEHDAEDSVQVVLVYTTQLPHNVIYDLLVRYTPLGDGGSPPASPFIDKAEWDAAAEAVTALITGYITEPTPVQQLIGEICEQSAVSVWPDPATGMIKLSALRPMVPEPTVTDRDWIIAGSLSLDRDPSKRASQVWVYYGQVDPTKDLEEKTNFASRLVSVDLEAEADTQYGVPAIREIFSRWIPQFGRAPALRCAERILSVFRDAPVEATFSLSANRDEALTLTKLFYLETADLQDDSGAPKLLAMAPVEIERGENEIGIKAQAVALAPTSDDEERIIYIDSDTQNADMRDIYDSLYSPPPEGVPTDVTFIVNTGVWVYSDDATKPALKTGTWPSTVTLKAENRGFIIGRGGDGASLTSGVAVKQAQAGGNAIELNHPLTLDNSTGYILGGGGGGGGINNPFSNDGGGPGPYGCGGGGGAGGGRGGNSNQGSGNIAGGAGGGLGLPGADGAINGTYNCQCGGGGGGRVPEGTGGVGAVSNRLGTAPTSAKGGQCGGGGGLATDEGNTSGGAGGTNLTNGGNATIAGGSGESAAGGGGGYGMSGGTATFSDMGAATILPPGGPGKAVALNGKVLTWTGSAAGQVSPKVRGAIS